MTSPFPVLIPPSLLIGKGAAQGEENLDDLSETMMDDAKILTFSRRSLERKIHEEG
jgi:hypothetical protein